MYEGQNRGVSCGKCYQRLLGFQHPQHYSHKTTQLCRHFVQNMENTLVRNGIISVLLSIDMQLFINILLKQVVEKKKKLFCQTDNLYLAQTWLFI